jgi:hypothetical protein
MPIIACDSGPDRRLRLQDAEKRLKINLVTASPEDARLDKLMALVKLCDSDPCTESAILVNILRREIVTQAREIGSRVQDANEEDVDSPLNEAIAASRGNRG